MPHQIPSEVAVIGGGPAGLMAAETVARAGVGVTIYDHMPALGRKLLMAGRGGLNLTHSEPRDAFLRRYGKAADALAPAIAGYPPESLVAWCEGLGEPTFVGSSGRVFPRSLKASPLLRAWLVRLASLGVTASTKHRWTGWNADGGVSFATPDGPRAAAASATILACGGASWPRLGSDGAWTDVVAPAVAVAPLRPSNCGFTIAWSDRFRGRFEGEPLKRIALSFEGRMIRGEAVITRGGIEGGAVYALSGAIRDRCPATIRLDLRPDLAEADLARRLDAPRGSQSLSNFLRKAGGLAPVGIALVQEALHATPAPGPAEDALPAASGADLSPLDLACLVKAVPLHCLAPSPIARAISSAGGIEWPGLDEHLMLRHRPGVFAAGEMLDWEAPTGGYLLQACFSTGVAAGRGALAWLGRA